MPESVSAGSARKAPRQRRQPTASAADRRDALLCQVATRYYLGQETQEEIAQGIGRSVATVSRLLARAEDAGVVEMDVAQPHALVPALQSALVKRFGLRVARVVHVGPSETHATVPRIGDLAARYLATILEPDNTISVGWGIHIQAVALAMPEMSLRDAHVVQALGSRGSPMPQIVLPRLVQSLAMRLEATPHFLPAPTVMNTVAEREALSQDPYFGKVLERIRQTDVALIGIGPTNFQNSALYRIGNFNEWDLERIRSRGAVGEMVAEFFDIQGRPVRTEVGQRVVGIREADLRRAGTVLAAAGGEAKAAAMLGALRSGVIDVLVTDSIATRAVLDLADEYPSPTFSVGQPGRSDARPREVNGSGSEQEVILQATLHELDRVGYQKLSPTLVAQEAHVPPERIYRQWGSRAALVFDAWRHRQQRDSNPGATLLEDLKRLLSWIPEPEAGGRDPHLAIRTMVAEAQLDPEFRGVFHALEQVSAEFVHEALQRAKARGEVACGASLDALADMILGAIWYRLLFGRRPLTGIFAEELADMAMRAAREDREQGSSADDHAGASGAVNTDQRGA